MAMWSEACLGQQFVLTFRFVTVQTLSIVTVGEKKQVTEMKKCIMLLGTPKCKILAD